MDLSGERFIPDILGPEVPGWKETAYEHWHRYLYASQFVAGKTVLDIACGEGYGSHWLAGVAKHVVGVDLDPDTVHHAASKYLTPNLEFLCGSVEVVPLEGKHLFDVVVSFETIEHVWSHQQINFLQEVQRLLKPEGLFLVSTPNKLFYSDQMGYINQFHQSELYTHDYLDLLKKFFRHVHLLGQKPFPVSYIWPVTAPLSGLSEHQLAFANGQFGPVTGDRKEVLHMLAVCSNQEIEAPGGSALLDVTGQSVLTPLEDEIPDEEEAPAPASAFEALVAPATQTEQPKNALSKEEEATQREIAELQQTMERYFQEQAVQRRAADLQRQVDTLAQENEANHRVIEELRQTIKEQNVKLLTLMDKLDGRNMPLAAS
jgi:ubiquinone/menaquinone biosynthesis C-methylase UbiE